MMHATSPNVAMPSSADQAMAGEKRPYVVFYDGRCGICRRSRRALEWLGPRASMRFVDVNDRAAMECWPQIDPQAAQMEVFALAPDGRVLSGYDAAIALLATVLRPLRWLMPLLRWGPVRFIGRLIYHWVSRHRHGISKLLFKD